MEIDDFVDQCEVEDDRKNQRYSECYALYNNGMIYACHQLMLQNIDNCVDLGAKQSRLYESIKREHTLVYNKSEKVKTLENWNEAVVSESCKGSDDTVKIYQNSENNATFLIDARLDAASSQAIALASRLEFADSWIHAVSTSAFVRQLSAHSHIVCLTMKNPIWTYFTENKVYVRIDTFDNILFDKTLLVIITPLSTAECKQYHIGGPDYQANARFFVFSALTFFFTAVSSHSIVSPHTTAKIYIEHMKIVRYTPMFINNIACVDCFSKVCRLWANTARQLGDMLYEGERLSKLVDFLEHQGQCLDAEYSI